MSLVIGGVRVDVPGLKTVSWYENPKLRLAIPKCGFRQYNRNVYSICLHTTKGYPDRQHPSPQHKIDGYGPNTGAGQRCAEYWGHSTNADGTAHHGGAHLVVDHDGQVSCLADLRDEVAFHAGGPINAVSVGIEIYQGGKAEVYDGQLSCITILVDFLTLKFGLQRQYQWPYRGRPAMRLQGHGRDWRGVFGHRDASSRRGFGDPGDFPFEKLMLAGYESCDTDKGEDLVVWKSRQRALGFSGAAVDGIPGPATCDRIKQAHDDRPDGLWVVRPIDKLLRL